MSLTKEGKSLDTDCIQNIELLLDWAFLTLRLRKLQNLMDLTKQDKSRKLGYVVVLLEKTVSSDRKT